MSWLYSRALVEAYWPQKYSDLKPSAPLNVMPTPHRFWHNDKMMDYSNLSQFGLTLQLLTVIDGEGLLMLYLVGFHVRTSAPQERAQESMAKEAGSGLKWSEFYARYDPHTCSLKMSQGSLFSDLEQSLQTFTKAGSMRNGACYQQPMLVRPTQGTDSGFLDSTPTALMPPETECPGERIRTLKSGRKRKNEQEGYRWEHELGAVDVAQKISSYSGALRVLHGLPYWMDRLKAIGNGQVPLCAAEAFRQLRERINERV